MLLNNYKGGRYIYSLENLNFNMKWEYQHYLQSDTNLLPE